MKAKRNLPLCVSQMDGGIVAVAWVAGTGTIRKSLLQSLSLGSHASWLIWCAWKWANAQERQRKPNPWATFDKLEPKVYHSNIFWHVFIQLFFLFFFHLALGKQSGANRGFLKLFSWFNAKLRNVFHSPEVSSSLKHITALVTWRPTYRHSINFC